MALLDELLGQQGQSVLRGTPYQSGGVNPALMQMIAQMTGPRMTPTPTPLAPGGSPLDMQIEEQIRARSQPEPFQPVDVPPAPGKLQTVLAALADAAGMYAGGLNPAVGPIGATGMLSDQRRQRADALRSNEMGRRLADFRGRQAGAELKLRQLLGQKEAETAKADQLAKETRDLVSKKAEIAARGEEELKQIKLRGENDSMQAKLDRESRERIAVADARAKKQAATGEDKVEARRIAQEQRKAVTEAKKVVVGLVRNIEEELKTSSPDQITENLALEFEGLGLDEESFAEVARFFDEKTGARFAKWRKEDYERNFEVPGPAPQTFMDRLGKRLSSATVMPDRRDR